MNELAELQSTIFNPMMALWTKVVSFIPNILSAAVLIVAGYFAAKFVRFLLSKALSKAGLDRLGEKSGVANILTNAGVKTQTSELIGILGFWLILLTFLVSAADVLGLPRVSSTIDDFVLYLPKVLGAALVILVGLFLARFVRNTVQGIGESMQMEYARGLGTAVYSLLVIVIASLAIGQLEIETDLLNQAVSILLISIGGAVALSLGLGTRDIAANIVAGVYTRELHKVGSLVELGDVRGRIVEVGTTKTIVKGKSRTYYVPNRQLIESRVVQDSSGQGGDESGSA